MKKSVSKAEIAIVLFRIAFVLLAIWTVWYLLDTPARNKKQGNETPKMTFIFEGKQIVTQNGIVLEIKDLNSN